MTFYDDDTRHDGTLTRHEILRRLLATPDLADSPRWIDRVRASWRTLVGRAPQVRHEVNP